MVNRNMLVEVRIEQARNRLHILAEKHQDFQHPAVLKQSMVLDELINQYNMKGEQQRLIESRKSFENKHTLY
ncbi:aspartyl-phosphate phosphatase Spo0E family protein [Paenibacillus sp. FSL K6-1217]|uniref:aspartyl-phosphate phosphatase Spo0E family protein n=1 Tax=Paenibacillus sp. FSL K6-1217 TaxID=2921466 RepID=UPI00324803F6